MSRGLTPLVVGFLLLVLLGSLRVHGLSLDPPTKVLTGYRDRAHIRDEGAKLHEARNKAVFGQWQLDPADEYAFWRRQSPVWVWSQTGWAQLFGLGWISARMLVVSYSLAMLGLFYWLVWVRYGLTAAAVSTLLLGTCWPYVVYSRLALMEAALLFWLVATGLCLALAARCVPTKRPTYLGLAVLVFLAATLTKQSGWLLAPAFVPALWWSRRAADDRGVARSSWAAGVGALAVIAVALGLVADPEYVHRLSFNAHHYMAAKDGGPTERALLRVWSSSAWRDAVSIVTRLAPYLLLPALAELACRVHRWMQTRVFAPGPSGTPAPVGRVQARSASMFSRTRALLHGGLGRRIDPVEFWWVGWLLLGVLANVATPHRAIRFQLIVLPPAAWLAAAFVARLSRRDCTSPVRRILLASIVAYVGVALAHNLSPWYAWMQRRATTLVDAGAQLESIIGDRPAVVVGEDASMVVLETPYRHYFIRPGQFNTSAETIAALGPTHLVEHPRRDFVVRALRAAAPERLDNRRRLGRIRYRGKWLTVWELVAAAR